MSVFLFAKIMNIAFLIQDFTTEGGTERTTCCLANEFARKGHTVSVVSMFRNSKEPVYETLPAVRLVYITSEKYNLELGIVKRLSRIARQLPRVKACKEIQAADVVISQKILASVSLWLSGLAYKSVACEHFKYEMYTPFLRRVRNVIYRSFLSTVVLTENDREKFAVSLPHVEVIPNMVSVHPMTYQGTDSKTIITVGRLERQKGYDLLLQALPIVYEKHPDWHVNIFGDGSEREALKKQRAELGLGNFVTFKGYVRNIEQEYAGSAFFVLSSRFEGFPMVLLEAAACGLPIVSFDCPEGPSTLLKNGGGLLVPIGDVGKLGETINLLIENHELRDKLMRQSQELVRLYAPESIYCKWLNLFREYGKAEAYEKA